MVKLRFELYWFYIKYQILYQFNKLIFLHVVVQPATLAANVKAVFTSLLDQVSWFLDRGFDQILVHTGSVFIFIFKLSKKEIQECF